MVHARLTRERPATEHSFKRKPQLFTMNVENPNGIIKIRFDGFLSCLLVKYPRVVDWPDCGGSVARYYACLPKETYKNPLLIEIEEKISSLTSVEDLKESGFLNLLESGDYEFELWENKSTSLLYNTCILNSNRTLFNWHKEDIGTNRASKPYSLGCFYPFGRQLMFTQPFESLDPGRINYYETIIKSGERPRAIALRVNNIYQEDEDTYQNTEDNTTKYVLDGHHKLVAYQNLKINPSYFVINRVNGKLDESELPNLEDYLFYYQIEHIVNNGIESIKRYESITEYIDKWIKKAPRIEDTLVRSLYQNANYPGYQNDAQKRKWFVGRLDVLKSKINSKVSELYLDYYCPVDYRRKYVLVNTWEDLIELLKLN